MIKTSTLVNKYREEIDTLRRIAVDLHWMARRYADGRSSYATGLFNDHTRALLRMGVKLKPTADKKLFVRDCMGRGYDGLTAADLEFETKYCDESAVHS